MANRAKSEFISRISHDIRTPIGAIANMTDFAFTDMNDKNKLQNDLRKIQTSNTLLLSLINDTLDMSKIENNQLSLNLQTADAETVIEEIKLLNFPTSITDGNA